MITTQSWYCQGQLGSHPKKLHDNFSSLWIKCEMCDTDYVVAVEDPVSEFSSLPLIVSCPLPALDFMSQPLFLQLNKILIFHWSIISLQYCVSFFCCTTVWITVVLIAFLQQLLMLGIFHVPVGHLYVLFKEMYI